MTILQQISFKKLKYNKIILVITNMILSYFHGQTTYTNWDIPIYHPIRNLYNMKSLNEKPALNLNRAVIIQTL